MLHRRAQRHTDLRTLKAAEEMVNHGSEDGAVFTANPSIKILLSLCGNPVRSLNRVATDYSPRTRHVVQTEISLSNSIISEAVGSFRIALAPVALHQFSLSLPQYPPIVVAAHRLTTFRILKMKNVPLL